MTRHLIGFAFVCLACLLVVPTQVQGQCSPPSSESYDPGDWADYEDCLDQLERDEQRDLEEAQRDLEEAQERRREDAQEVRQQAEDAWNDALEEGVGDNAKDLADAMQETPAVQLADAAADAAADVADTVKCYDDCVDENVETITCTAWGISCTLYGMYDPTKSAVVGCLVTQIFCEAYQRTYTAVTTCREVCSG